MYCVVGSVYESCGQVALHVLLKIISEVASTVEFAENVGVKVIG